MLGNLSNLDGRLLLLIQDFIRNPVLTPVFRLLTTLGNNDMIWIIISLFLLMFKKTRKVGAMALIALLFSFLIVNLTLKNLFERTRPYDVVTGLRVLIDKPHDYSFPSGHASSSFAAATVYFKSFRRKFGIPAVLLACLIGFSRLYLGVHYPSDVIAGAVTGMIIAYFVWKGYLLYGKWRAERVMKKEKERCI